MKSETDLKDVKTERESDVELGMGSEMELYAEHEIKEEMVIGPVVLQRAAHNYNTKRCQDAPLLNKARLERERNETDQFKSQKEIEENDSEQFISNIVNTLTDTKKRAVKSEGLKVQTPKILKNANIFICNDRGKHFGKKWALAAHNESHTEVKQDNKLTRQLRVYSGKKPYSCSLCEYKCALKCDFMKHLGIHSVVEEPWLPYSCSLCEFKCALKSHLMQHLRIHSGERPYFCSLCEHKFTKMWHLTRHSRIHTGPYSCSLCEYKSTKKACFTRHLRIHSVEKSC